MQRSDEKCDPTFVCYSPYRIQSIRLLFFASALILFLSISLFSAQSLSLSLSVLLNLPLSVFLNLPLNHTLCAYGFQCFHLLFRSLFIVRFLLFTSSRLHKKTKLVHRHIQTHTRTAKCQLAFQLNLIVFISNSLGQYQIFCMCRTF